MVTKEEINNNTKISIVIGITGHRDLREEDILRLEKEICSIFQELKEKYPSTPLVLLSPLAEGADRLAARSALNCGLKLIVPLPMAKEEYEKDFTTEKSIDEFNRLLKSAAAYFELPPAGSLGSNREHNYNAVGAYIAQHSHILIALWDGIETNQVGGTAQVVKFKLKGVPESYTPPQNFLDPVDTGPVYHIITPRIKNPSPEGDAFTLKKCFPDGLTAEGGPEKGIDNILQGIEQFNKDTEIILRRLQREISSSKSQLFPVEDEKGLQASVKPILGYYAQADAMANYFQRKRRYLMIGLYCLALLAFFFFELYAHLIQECYLIGLYPTTLLLAFILYIWVKKRGYENKYLDYRALAEGLRIQLFWKITGLKEDVTRYYLRKQKSELDWVRKGIESVTFLNQKTGLTGRTDSKLISKSDYWMAYKHWVAEQRNYFEKSANRDRRSYGNQELAVYGFFLFGLVIAVIVLLMDISSFHLANMHSIHNILIIVMGLAPAIAAALDSYAEKMAFNSQTKVYKRMHFIFDRAAVKLKEMLENNDLDGAGQLILELGREALLENGDWVLMHRDRPMKMPIDG
ncbi:MAG: hypothetical protein A4E53_00678 [Pelotomaculum sp. PtaB.Bin104]|nr:MAG: hypothetical protein A4E53_00678 [Pelotomaculum sp. PtaB.Bin104]